MSFFTTVHSANVIVRVTSNEWQHCPLVAVDDWLFDNDGYFSRRRTLANSESDGLMHYVKSQFREKVLFPTGKSLKDSGRILFTVFPLCRLVVKDIPGHFQGDHCLEFQFRDFDHNPHYKHAGNFVNTTCQRRSGICGFDYTSISFEQPIDCVPASDEQPHESWIQPQRLLRTLRTFFEKIMLTGSWQDPLWQIIDGLPLRWPGPCGIDVAVSLANVKDVHTRVLKGVYPSWKVTAKDGSQPSLRFTLTPAIRYEKWRNTNPEDGKSLYGFATTLKGLLDIGR